MLDDFRALAVFVAVAEEGSFSGAGRQLRLSTSVVSHHISKLEERLGVPLFFRSTRSMSLTAEGEGILESARRMVEAKQAVLDSLAAGSDQPVGHLRITIPTFGENTWICQGLLAFAQKHDSVSLDLHLSDTAVDLIKEGYDLGFRFGNLKDSSLKTRRVGDFERILVASAAYLRQRPSIDTVDDLKHCDFISLGTLPTGITLTRGKQSQKFEPPKTRIHVNTVAAGKAAILAGLGIQRLPKMAVDNELKNGSLIHVLPDWALPTLGVYAIWPQSGQRKQLTQRLIEHLMQSSGVARP